jgi:hypothetical protein
MNRARNLCTAAVGRRCFFRSLAGLALCATVAKLPFGAERPSKMTSADQEYVIVNGWVLTREDLAAAETSFDAV